MQGLTDTFRAVLQNKSRVYHYGEKLNYSWCKIEASMSLIKTRRKSAAKYTSFIFTWLDVKDKIAMVTLKP